MWIVVSSFPSENNIEEFDTYEEALEIFNKYEQNIGVNETVYIAEVKLFKRQRQGYLR